MQLEHSFSVPVGIDEAWRLLLDIERIAPCIPGATIDSVDGDEITGAIKVRLGTIGPTYKGSATVAERDPEGHRAIINAHGETRSSGSATARVIATLSEFGGSTSIMLMTEIDFTGKPAQLERTVISDAGARVVRQFAERLAALLAEQVITEAVGAEAAKPIAEEPIPEQSVPEQSVPEQSAAEQPTAEQPAKGQSLTVPPVSQEPPVPDGVAATPARRPRPSPRPSAGAPETAKSTTSTAPGAASAPAAAASEGAPASAPTAASTTVAASDRVVPRHANSTKPHVEVIPAEPAAGLELLLKRLAPFAILVMILLLRRRRQRH